ncbi:MAG: VOC family protein [Myxococcales bacterium]|nr:VOC family protein [Myxococcales bacterium]
MTVQPRLVVDEPDTAITFYREAFGAELTERFVDGAGVVVHATLRLGASTVSITQAMASWRLLSPKTVGDSPVLMHLTVDDPDAACSRAVERGSVVVIPIENRPYGKREGRVRDPFGHLWILSRPLEALTAAQIQERLAP